MTDQHSNWRVWEVADQLEASSTLDDAFSSTKHAVVAILRRWGAQWAGDPRWVSILNKKKLYQECEESIVALHYLWDFLLSSNKNKNIIVMDVCAGKGFFSFILTYLCSHYNNKNGITEIIMIEKSDNIDWHHIEEVNRMGNVGPKITIWDNTNLHHQDDVLDRMLSLPDNLALSGIHLCKQLSPTFCGLVNGLGTKCRYACLAPCCLPRAVTAQKNAPETKQFTISVRMPEELEERQNRLSYMKRRELVRRKPVGGPCFYCHDDNHGLRDCPMVPTLTEPEQVSIRQAWHAATIPCWNCLEYGHYKSDCPTLEQNNNKCSWNHASREPPLMELNVSGVLQASRPYERYCHLLVTAFARQKETSVQEVKLEKFANHSKGDGGGAGNWNSERKSIFIVVK